MSASAEAALSSVSGQRWSLLGRNRAARHGRQGSSAAALLKNALAGGLRASGLPLGGMALGQRADLQKFDVNHPVWLGLTTDRMLNAFVSSSQAWQALLNQLWPKRVRREPWLYLHHPFRVTPCPFLI